MNPLPFEWSSYPLPQPTMSDVIWSLPTSLLWFPIRFSLLSLPPAVPQMGQISKPLCCWSFCPECSSHTLGFFSSFWSGIKCHFFRRASPEISFLKVYIPSHSVSLEHFFIVHGVIFLICLAFLLSLPPFHPKKQAPGEQPHDYLLRLSTPLYLEQGWIHRG